MAVRKIIEIDESKCDGCGRCVPACAEGALQIINGKARLVSEVYCDGLGACLGECPRGAITITEREASAFDEQAALRHVEDRRRAKAAQGLGQACGCPGAAVRQLNVPILQTGNRPAASPAAPVAATNAALPATGTPSSIAFGTAADRENPAEPSALGHWPVQLHLVPPGAPFLENADLLLVADCVPFAMPDFHRRLLCGRPVVIGCPKLDDVHAYLNKLTAILTRSSVRSLTVVHMEVPCCSGLSRLAHAAVQAAGVEVPVEDITISLRGEMLNPLPIL